MTDVDALRSQPVPREEALVRRLGRGFSPAWGFVAYGVLYGMVVPGTVWLGVVVGLALLLGDRSGTGRPIAAWREGILFGGSALAALLSWWPFVRWVRSRRGDAYRLFREGQFVEGRVTSVGILTLRGSRVTRATVQLGDGSGRAARRETTFSVGGEPPEVRTGASFPVLVHPRCRYAAVVVGGALLPARS
jgi:hypothetical protein